GNVDVLAPNASGKTVGCVVCQFDGFLQRAESHRSKHRPENLFLCHRRTGMHVRQQSRRIIKSLRGKSIRRLRTRRTLADTLVDQALDAIELYWSNDGSDIDSLIKR